MVVLLIAGILVLLYLAALFYRKKDQQPNPYGIPGLKPSDPNEGNNGDIKKANGMNHFVADLHRKFGPIAAFWEGKQLAVSVASPDLLKAQRHLCNQALEILEPFRIITGDDCFGLMNGEEVTRRRKIYDNYFNLKGCKSYTATLSEIAHDYIEKWKKLSPEDHLPLQKTMMEASLRGILRTSYGNYFMDDQSLSHFQKLFTDVFMDIFNNVEKNTPEYEKMEKKAKEVQDIVKKILEIRRKEQLDDEKKVFVDVLLEDYVPESQCLSDSIVMIGAGFDTTAKMLLWAIYELAVNPDIEQKVYTELMDVLGENPIELEDVLKLVYLRQFIDEIMRIYLAPAVIGRKLDQELKLDNYTIPKGSNVYQALGIVLNDPKIWPDPEKVDPDRFAPQNSKGRSPFAFKPFGFAGKRQCPGQTYSYIKMAIFLGEWCRNFKFKLVPDQKVEKKWAFSVVPKEEIWITIEPRK